MEKVSSHDCGFVGWMGAAMTGWLSACGTRETQQQQQQQQQQQPAADEEQQLVAVQYFNPLNPEPYPATNPSLRSRHATSIRAVHLMSLRLQLQQPAGSTKPIIAATLNEGGAHDSSRCCAVAWVPRSGGAQFLAAHVSGSILVYKKVHREGGWVGGVGLWC